jgi:hypothetical protein
MDQIRVWLRSRRVKIWAAAISFAGIALVAIVNAVITTERVDDAASGIADVVSEPFTEDRAPPEPSRADQIVSAYIADTRDAGIWATKPVFYPESERYLRRHFRDFDPSRPHPIGLLPVERRRLTPTDVVNHIPFLTGDEITVVGVVGVNQDLSIIPGKASLVDRVTQLQDAREARKNPDSPLPLVYCRNSESVRHRLEEGHLAIARGVVIAAGQVITQGSGGSVPAAYMACFAVHPYPFPPPR